MKKRAIAFLRFALRLSIGAVFVWSSWGKLQDPALFQQSVLAYDMLPYLPASLFAMVLPMVEMLCGVALALTKWHREAALLICAMLVAFMVALAQALFRGLDISCGCFSGDADRGAAALLYAIARDAALLAPSAWLVFPVKTRSEES